MIVVGPVAVIPVEQGRGAFYLWIQRANQVSIDGGGLVYATAIIEGSTVVIIGG